MTTRKEFLARIASMPLGTQEQLDAAANDATRIPFDTLFQTEEGEVVLRQSSDMDDARCLKMPAIGLSGFYSPNQLRVLPEGDEC